MTLAEGESSAEKVVSLGNSLAGSTMEALGQWLPELSPMTVFFFNACIHDVFSLRVLHGAW